MTNLVAYERLDANRKVVVRATLFAIPLLLPLAYIALLQAALPPVFFGIAFGAMLGYLVTPLGAEFWVPSSVLLVLQYGGGLPEATVAVASIVLIDWFTALFLLWNFDLAERAPFLGKFIEKTEVRCRRFLDEKPWRRRLAAAALALYVALPVQMSGGVVGSILGGGWGSPGTGGFGTSGAAPPRGRSPSPAGGVAACGRRPRGIWWGSRSGGGGGSWGGSGAGDGDPEVPGVRDRRGELRGGGVPDRGRDVRPRPSGPGLGKGLGGLRPPPRLGGRRPRHLHCRDRIHGPKEPEEPR